VSGTNDLSVNAAVAKASTERCQRYQTQPQKGQRLQPVRLGRPAEAGNGNRLSGSAVLNGLQRSIGSAGKHLRKTNLL